mgnify:CR=1 FL=1|jgi:hypothetical protein
MKAPYNDQPIVCIDLKKNRIRVHKTTLHLIGDPDYIQLLVNPKTGMIAIRPTVAEDHLGLKIRKERLVNGDCYEIHSKELLDALKNVRTEWHSNCSYRIYGEYNATAQIAQFAMKDIVPVEDTINHE